MRDTDPAVAAEYRRMLLPLAPGRRMAMACAMFQTAKAMARAGNLSNGPLPESEVRRQLFLRFYGRDFSPEERDRILGAL